MDDIHVKLKWTEEEMLTAFERHWKIGFQKVANILLTLLGVLFLGLGLYSVAIQGYSLLAACFFIVGLYFTVARRVARRSMVRLRTRQSPAYGKTVDMSFSDTGIHTRIPEAYNSQVKWDYYSSALATPEGIMLYQNPAAFLWLPTSAFESDKDFLNMLDLLQKHVMEFKESE